MNPDFNVSRFQQQPQSFDVKPSGTTRIKPETYVPTVGDRLRFSVDEGMPPLPPNPREAAYQKLLSEKGNAATINRQLGLGASASTDKFAMLNNLINKVGQDSFLNKLRQIGQKIANNPLKALAWLGLAVLAGFLTTGTFGAAAGVAALIGAIANASVPTLVGHLAMGALGMGILGATLFKGRWATPKTKESFDMQTGAARIEGQVNPAYVKLEKGITELHGKIKAAGPKDLEKLRETVRGFIQNQIDIEQEDELFVDIEKLTPSLEDFNDIMKDETIENKRKAMLTILDTALAVHIEYIEKNEKLAKELYRNYSSLADAASNAGRSKEAREHRKIASDAASKMNAFGDQIQLLDKLRKKLGS